MKVYLADIVGIKSGMDAYLESFSEVLNSYDIKSEILSNYQINGKHFYPNIYEGNILVRLFKLLLSCSRFAARLVALKRTEIVVLSTYGTVVDAMFILIAAFSRKTILDVHEAVFLDSKSVYLRKMFKLLYSIIPNNVVYHSDKTKTDLQDLGYGREMIYVPLFPYSMKKEYCMTKIGLDVRDSISTDAINCLFFGNIRPSKGIYELISLVERFKEASCHRNVRFIIAGQDIFNVLSPLDLTHISPSFCRIVSRRINDDEMSYLFSKSDYILLPYKEVSQSAVLEVAVNYRKPVIASSIISFQEIIDRHPSFGHIMCFTDTKAASKLIEILGNDKADYFADSDLRKYSQIEEFDNFVLRLRNVMKLEA